MNISEFFDQASGCFNRDEFDYYTIWGRRV